MHKTDYLVANNSFLSGIGRVIDIGSTRNKHKYNASRSSSIADSRALKNDWNMVGQDLKGAYNEFKTKEKIKALS